VITHRREKHIYILFNCWFLSLPLNGTEQFVLFTKEILYNLNKFTTSSKSMAMIFCKAVAKSLEVGGNSFKVVYSKEEKLLVFFKAKG
jgi:hypothetical protein